MATSIPDQITIDSVEEAKSNESDSRANFAVENDAEEMTNLNQDSGEYNSYNTWTSSFLIIHAKRSFECQHNDNHRCKHQSRQRLFPE